jgi:hypothetical protein
VPGAVLPGLEDFLLGGDLAEGVFGLAVPEKGFGLAVGGLADEGREPGLGSAAGGVVGVQGGEVAGVPGPGLLGLFRSRGRARGRGVRHGRGGRARAGDIDGPGGARIIKWCTVPAPTATLIWSMNQTWWRASWVR